MKQTKKQIKKTENQACPILNLKDKNDLFMLSPDTWNNQDNRSFILNADFRQMDSARDKK